MKNKNRKAFKIADVEDHFLGLEGNEISEVIGENHYFDKTRKVSFRNAKYSRRGVYERYLENNGWLD